MDRIAIIGCGGSGKTHLANQLAALVNLPMTHLDAVYYDTDWNPLPQEEFADLQRDLVAQPRWLIEGNYAGTLPIRLAAADTVIFLDLHAIPCLAGIAQRRWRYRGGQHTKDGVYDRITWNFVRYIWRYRKSMRPRVRQLMDEHGGNARFVTLTSRRQAARFVAQLRGGDLHSYLTAPVREATCPCPPPPSPPPTSSLVRYMPPPGGSPSAPGHCTPRRSAVATRPPRSSTSLRNPPPLPRWSATSAADAVPPRCSW